MNYPVIHNLCHPFSADSSSLIEAVMSSFTFRSALFPASRWEHIKFLLHVLLRTLSNGDVNGMPIDEAFIIMIKPNEMPMVIQEAGHCRSICKS